MSESNHDRSKRSASQRPTVEIADDAALEFATMPPSASSRPSSPLDRETVPGSACPSWAPVVATASLPFEYELRLLIGVLQALAPIHTNLLVPPHDRVHGRICRENIVVDPDGSVHLRPQPIAFDPPAHLQAPEAVGGAVIDQQADIYSVGTLIMAAVESATDREATLRERVRAVAARAVRLDPHARWTSARELARELELALSGRLPSWEALAGSLRDRGQPLVPPRPSSPSIPDRDVEFLQPPPSAPSPSHLETNNHAHDPIERAPVSFDPRRLATSTAPEDSPRKRSNWSLWLAAALVVIGVAVWALGRGTEANSPVASETTTGSRGPERNLPESRDLAPAEEPAGSETKIAPPPERPRPTVTGVLPPVFSPLPTQSAERAAPKAKAKPKRTTTYDPEGI